MSFQSITVDDNAGQPVTYQQIGPGSYRVISNSWSDPAKILKVSPGKKSSKTSPVLGGVALQYELLDPEGKPQRVTVNLQISAPQGASLDSVPNMVLQIFRFIAGYSNIGNQALVRIMLGES